jgi:hypothetical protein
MAIKDPLALPSDELIQTPIVGLIYKQLTGRSVAYHKVDNYIAGNHDLSFATQKFTNAFGALFRAYSENLIPRILGTLTDYLRFQKPEPGSGPSYMTTDDEEASEALNIWLKAQLFPIIAGQVHSDAYKYGNGYVIVGFDDLKSPRIYRQDARQLSVIYDPERPDQIIAAAKVWTDLFTAQIRMNIYTLSGTYSYYAPNSNSVPQEAKSFLPFGDEPYLPHLVPGIVPVFHFANDPDTGGQGKSELNDLYPLQDALNKDNCDRLVAQEFQAFRQRWATGIETEIDENGKVIPPMVPGIDRLWFSANETAKFGDFEPIEIEQFLKVAQSDRLSLAILSRVPVHHLIPPDGDFPSGEAQKTAEMPTLNKTADRQESWGAVWASMAAYWFLINGGQVPSGIACNWADMTPRDKTNECQGDMFEANAATSWNQLGVPKRQLLLEKGYTPEQIDEFETQIQGEQEDAAAAQSALLDRTMGRPNMGRTMNPNQNDGSAKQ